MESNHEKHVFTAEEAFKNAMSYFNQDELAATTWLNKYALKDEEGNYLELNPDDMHRRMAKEFARMEQAKSVVMTKDDRLSDYGKERQPLTNEAIFELFRDFRYVIPQGSVMASLGNTYMLASLSNCVVLPEIYDSYGGIFRADQQIAQLFKRRCGVGLDLSPLRPADEPVSNAAGTTSGAVSFMERFSNTTREVAQHGRRGALMLTMDVRHPDIEDFVKSKQDLRKVTGANISVKLTDAFMMAVESDSDFRLQWPVDSPEPQVVRNVKAKELWETIVSCAHATAEPGLLFWDRQHLYSTSSVYPEYRNISTNPCSEVAMQGGDSCRLIALNLLSFVKEPFSPQASFDFELFYRTTYEAQRLMDDLVDLEIEAIDRILDKIGHDPEPVNIKEEEYAIWKLLRENGLKARRTGLGFTALADTLAALGLIYGSEASISMAEKIAKEKCRAEFDSSIDLAIERGPFQGFDPGIENTSDFVHMLKAELPEVYERMMKYGRRNVSISTVAPTGSLSILSQTSAGIEPVFELHYKRRRKVNITEPGVQVDFVDALGDAWQEFDVLHPGLIHWMERNGQLDARQSPYHNATANEIDWRSRIEMQRVVQKYVTHSISSTINLPSETTVDRISGIYLESWHAGLKGITIYREGSRSGVLISPEPEPSEENIFPKERPVSLNADIIRFMNGAEKWVAVIGLLDGKPYEVFTGRIDASFDLPDQVEKGWVVKKVSEEGANRYDLEYYNESGNKCMMKGLSSSFNKEFWNYAILISGMLRKGIPLNEVITLITDLNLRDDMINTWKNGVSRALRHYLPDGSIGTERQCPNCGDPDGLVFKEGCLVCKSCGYTTCS